MPNFKRYVIDGAIYFITTNTFNKRWIFENEKFSKILLSNINFYRNEMGFKFFGYVIMPWHLHCLIQPTPNKKFTISDIMRSIKYRTASDIRKLRQSHTNVSGSINSCRSGLNKNHCRSGPGPDLQVGMKHKAPDLQKEQIEYHEIINGKIWQDRFYDEIIKDEIDLKNKFDYIHENPVKAGLVKYIEDYKFSSYINYYLNDNSLIKIDLIEL